MTEVICKLNNKDFYRNCNYNKDGKCTRDKIVMIYGDWEGDDCGVCATGMFGEGEEID